MTKTFTDIAQEASSGSEELKKSGLSFDVSQFKAKKEVSTDTSENLIIHSPVIFCSFSKYCLSHRSTYQQK